MKLIRLFPFIFLLFVGLPGQAQNAAQDLFQDYRDSLYQIRLIELESGKKSSIGSGFQIDEQGRLATNYHVVSSYVFHPEKYRMEYLDAEGGSGELQLIGFDVINDLALVSKTSSDSKDYLPLAKALPNHGAPIYSLGNPHDLGMIVVPGTFNGLKKNSFYQRIHFTGSINPGMSGGPVVDEAGAVMGVNVATAGNQIGFLIPLGPLQQLISQHGHEPLPSDQFKTRIGEQLQANQSALVSQLTEADWTTTNLGEAKVPDRVVDFLSCWGGSNRGNDNVMFLSVNNRCRLDEQVFLHQHLRTGALEMEFEWLASDTFESHRFYNFFSKSFSSAEAGNFAGKNDVSNYRCSDDQTINVNNMVNKTVLCLRAYKDFEQLYDVLFIAASLEKQQAGLISHFTLSGVDKASAVNFTQHFMDSLAWQ